MEFGWSQAQENYRERIRAALRELLPADWHETYTPQSYASDAQIEFSRKFCPQLAERGLLVRHWPKEWGGEGGDDWEQFILAEEMKVAGEPRGPQYMNVNWIGPTLMRFATPEQREKYLPGIARGTTIWCQGFSEPGAGTDLAALRTKAERIGDRYRINGSKIWTSYARKADMCFLLARTGAGRKEITVLLVPMATMGVSVTSNPGLCKDGHLNEVFFTDVDVAIDARLGEEGQGWAIVTHALSFERTGVPRYHVGIEVLGLAIAQLKAEGRADDPIVRARAGMIAAQFEAARALTYLVVDQRVKRAPENTDANVARITALDAVVELMNFLVEFTPDCLAGGDAQLEEYYRINVPAGVTAGTYELQLDLIAQRGLGLPRG
ncbi:MAG: acyl-CoA dehydrogenase family protein [Hydrogenophilaceae bacterium]|jgi:alkylation response protein AidB-like acyl-CoA dehydrogenase|nr:acyl-CoA dehydrogenase family protein [Hydrogenophilaceae bacterium]